MPIRITRISVVNCNLPITDMKQPDELKDELTNKLKVTISDIHFSYSETPD